jgi:hypothetical protein
MSPVPDDSSQRFAEVADVALIVSHLQRHDG